MTLLSLAQTIAENRAGKVVAMPSVCSAHRDVLRAAMLMPEYQNRTLLIEATSNQVNQFGGYTGMTPSDFVSYVHEIASETGFNSDHIIFGGDHLGPQAWKDEPAEAAMEKAKAMVAAYVQAGFTKIHLDCSEGCAGEPAHLDDATVADRAAILAEICETSAPDAELLGYIVGTEVPVPGGARTDHKGVEPTAPAAAIATMNAHLERFSTESAGRICGLVVQPGVEFGAEEIDHLPLVDETGLRGVLANFDGLTLEAHSTDYQEIGAYGRLAEMGFAIHKVGPALTFAYRQAIYALDHIRATITGEPTKVISVMEEEMLANPKFWQGHYEGSDEALRLLRHFSFSDRIRYYWPQPKPQQVVTELMQSENLLAVSDPVLSQFFCSDTINRARSLSFETPLPERLVMATIQTALSPYILCEDAAA